MAETIAEFLAKLGVDADTDTIDKFNAKMGETGKKSTGLAGPLKVAGAGIAAVGAAATATAAALLSMTKNVASQADEIAKSSKQLNVNATEYQRLRGAIQLSGGGVSDLDRGIRTLTKGLSDAKEKGTGPFAEGLEKLGLDVEDLEADLLAGNIENVLGTVGDAFNATGDSAGRNAALIDLFGAKAGSQLRPLLEEGSDGIRSLGDDISATGGVIDAEALPKFEKMQDDLLKLDQTVFGVKATIAEALTPVVSDISAQMQEWILQNEDFLKKDVPEFIELMIEAGREFLPILLELFVETKNLVGQLREFEEETGALSTTWEILVTAIEVSVAPIMAIAEALTEVAEAVGLVDSQVQTVAKRGGVGFGAGTGGGQKFEASSEAQAGAKAAGATAFTTFVSRRIKGSAQADRLNENTSLNELRRHAANKNAPIEVRQKAAALLPIVGMRNALIEGASERAIAAGRGRPKGGTGSVRKKGKGGKKAAKKEPTLEELIAGATGDSVDAELPDMAKRAPTVVVQITRNDVRIELAPNFPNISDPDQAARATVELIKEELVGQNVRTGQEIAPGFAR